MKVHCVGEFSSMKTLYSPAGAVVVPMNPLLKAREIGLRVPFSYYEIASFVYDYDVKPVRTVARALDK